MRRELRRNPLAVQAAHPGGDVHAIDLVKVCRRQNLFRLPKGNSTAMVHQEGVRAESPGERQIMHHAHNRAARRLQPLANQGEDLLLVDEIEMVRRFVEQQQLRILRQNLCEKRALQFAAGERKNLLLAFVLHAGQG